MLRIIYTIIVIATLTSCKTIHNLSSKDNSTQTKKTTQQPTTRHKGDVVFIDNIQVTPGNAVTSSQKPKTTQAPKQEKKDDNVTVSYTEPVKTKASIENADQLQLKYAIILDATVEKLTNTAMLQAIDDWWGTRYCYGGSSKNCVDCSWFTRSIMRNVYNIDLARTAHEQFDNSQHIEMQDLKEGDLVFFQTTGRKISHVGIYLLNNKFVHAAASQGVGISDLNDSYWRSRYRGAGRMVLNDEGIKP